MSTPTTIGAALDEAARRHGNATAYVDRDTPYTFKQFDEVTDRVACGLLKAGLSRGDRIGLLALNQIEWLQVFFAAAKIGVGVIGMSVRYRQTEFELMLKDSDAKALFTLSSFDGFDFVGLADRMRTNVPSLDRVFTLGAGGGADGDLEALAATPLDRAALAAAQAQVQPDDLAMVIYTSGTTGRPKGAALTHRTMLAAAAAEARHIKAVPGDLVQLAMPFNHVGGITCGILTLLLAGGCCELVPAFKADVVLGMMAKRPPTLIIGVPTMLTLLLMNRATIGADLGSVRLVITGGANADSTLLTQLQQAMPQATVMNLYGLSEASGALVMTPWDSTDNELLTSIGTPLHGAQMRLIDLEGNDAPAGEVGELCFRGLGVVSGYIGIAQSDSFDSDQWLHTGDLALIDGRGLIVLKGRLKEMFIQGGFNVYPAEVESVIAKHPNVLMVAGIGVSDPVLGEIGRYFVVPKAGRELTETEIKELCKRQLADYKVPRQIVFRDQLPMTPAGKVQKAALRSA